MDHLKLKTQILVGHVHKSKKKGMTKEEIRNDEGTQRLLNRVFDEVWKVCEEADRVMKEAAEF